MLLLIDNYDSFTYNLYQYFCELGAEVLVKRNDELQLADIERLAPQHLVISPAPVPRTKRVSRWPPFVISPASCRSSACASGHCALGQAFGAEVVRARAVMHGKTSAIRHPGVGVFHGLSDPLTVTRYHSLVLKADTLPDCFEVTARSERDGVRDGSWASATALWRWKACSSIRKACSASRATSCWIISSSVNSAAFFARQAFCVCA